MKDFSLNQATTERASFGYSQVKERDKKKQTLITTKLEDMTKMAGDSSSSTPHPFLMWPNDYIVADIKYVAYTIQ